MSDLMFGTPTTDPPTSTPSPAPPDDLNVPSADPPHTIYCLTITTPHTDSFAFRGPVRAFADLLPDVVSLASASKAAMRKLARLRADPLAGLGRGFDERGFVSFTITFDAAESGLDSKPALSPSKDNIENEDGKGGGKYTYLRIIRAVNEPVHAALPAPVFLVTASGPLRSCGGRLDGWARTGRVVGCFADVGVARERARDALGALVKEEVEGDIGKGGEHGVVQRSEKLDDSHGAFGKMDVGSWGRGIFLAMGREGRVWQAFVWEQRVGVGGWRLGVCGDEIEGA